MILEKLTIILIVFVWASDSLADNHRSKRSSNGYILHKCIATAELIRKHRNEEVVGVNSRKNEDLPQLQVRSPDSVAMILSNIYQPEISRRTPSSIHQYMTRIKSRRYASQNFAHRHTSRQTLDFQEEKSVTGTPA